MHAAHDGPATLTARLPTPQQDAGGSDVVAGMLQFINTQKLATNKPPSGAPHAVSVSSKGQPCTQMKWVQPSGERAAQWPWCSSLCAATRIHDPAGEEAPRAGQADQLAAALLCSLQLIPLAKPPSAPLSALRPSGPRKPGEGTENEEQGIIAADPTEHGCAARLAALASWLAAELLWWQVGGWRRRVSHQ
jgi:hypothetical protein